MSAVGVRCPTIQSGSRKQAFEIEIRSRWADIVRQKGNPGINPQAAAILATTIYRNTISSPLPFIVIGPNRIRKDVSMSANLGIITGYTPKKKKEVFEPMGCILGENQWSTLINDFFILAAVHSGKQIQTTLSRFPEFEDLWDDKHRTLTTLGREFAILLLAKYVPVQVRIGNSSQLCFRPPCDESFKITYEDVFDSLKVIDNPRDARSFLLS